MVATDEMEERVNNEQRGASRFLTCAHLLSVNTALVEYCENLFETTKREIRRL